MSHSYDELKKLHRILREEWGDDKQDFSIRIHRALSWLQRAEQEQDDADASFIFLWIGFNAAYGEETTRTDHKTTLRKISEYFTLINKIAGQEIHDTVGTKIMAEIKNIFVLEFVMSDFWEENATGGDTDWKKEKKQEQMDIGHALMNGNVKAILQMLFKRLYVLRNQLIHGGATWGGKVNRAQVENGNKIMMVLLPLFLHIMMHNPNHDWGKIAYPVIEE